MIFRKTPGVKLSLFYAVIFFASFPGGPLLSAPSLDPETDSFTPAPVEESEGEQDLDQAGMRMKKRAGLTVLPLPGVVAGNLVRSFTSDLSMEIGLSYYNLSASTVGYDDFVAGVSQSRGELKGLKGSFMLHYYPFEKIPFFVGAGFVSGTGSTLGKYDATILWHPEFVPVPAQFPPIRYSVHQNDYTGVGLEAGFRWIFASGFHIGAGISRYRLYGKNRTVNVYVDDRQWFTGYPEVSTLLTYQTFLENAVPDSPRYMNRLSVFLGYAFTCY